MKNILSSIFMVLFLVAGVFQLKAQETDTIIDGVVAVVGGNVILKSDIESQYLQFRLQGNIKGSPSTVKCQILENMLFQKLLLHQAELDSVKITDTQIENEIDNKMRYFISQIGSPEKLEEYYQKSLVEIKNELRDVQKEQDMIEMTRQKITKDVTVTPSEVKAFFRKLPKDSIPEINSELEIGFISKQPVIGDAEKDEAKNRLQSFRDRIKKGDDFSTLAILYSEDPGSAKQGGELGLFKRGEMKPEFEAAAFKLKPGEISDVVETDFGYHLIQMIERRGEYINVRHILIKPKVSLVSLNRAKTELDSVANLIEKRKISFDDAVVKFSDDPTRNSGGMLINESTSTSRFEASQLDPKIFFVIDKLKEHEISSPVLYKTEKGTDEYRIYYLKTRTAPHKATLEQDYAKIQEMTLKEKQNDEINDWIQKKSAKSYIRIADQYKNCDFRNKWK
ncbi:MAG: peptidylprolyl isomerase [Bacteroidota bacterium]|nr:peptidylprolyl isomerase [Bacteroidota bacterium]